MSYLPARARKKFDISLTLKVCPNCLGDLVRHADFSGEYFRCLQCNERMEPRSGLGRLRDLTPIADSFPGADRVAPEVLLS